MNTELSQISVDLALILRVIAAFLWGWGFGFWLHLTRKGQILERQYTWLATVVGLAVDMAIAFPESWFVVAAVISASAIGIIALAQLLGYPDDVNANSYKLKWGLEDGIATASRIVDDLTELLKRDDLPQPIAPRVSKALARSYTLKGILVDARKGEYSQKKL